MNNKLPEVFISYSWTIKGTAKKIFESLAALGIRVVIDDHSIQYAGKISEFMKRIRSADFVLLLINDNFLKSANCMNEIMELIKDEDCWDKVMPIVEQNVSIYNPIDRLKYVAYWQDQAKNLEIELEGIKMGNAVESYRALTNQKRITSEIESFLNTISDMRHITPRELVAQNYRPLLDKMDLTQKEIASMSRLLEITKIRDLKSKGDALRNFTKVFITNSYYYSVLGGYYRDQKKFETAKKQYLIAIELDFNNMSAHNNLGQIYENVDQDYTSAKNAYENAISVTSETSFQADIPRLNLGLLLKDHFKDYQGAKEQFEEILKFAPFHAGAHNNLGNYYRNVKHDNRDRRIRYHFETAIESDPSHIPSYLNYANYLRAEKDEVQRSKLLCRQALDHDTKGVYKRVIETMLKA